MMEGKGLGKAMVDAVANIEPGLMLLVAVICYVIGLVMFIQGGLRLLKTSQDKFHAPSGMGTVLSFVVGLVMVWLPSWLEAAGRTLFGASENPVRASLGYGAKGAEYDALLGAVFAIIGWVGLFAFVRGALMLRAASDGKPGATAGGAFVHMVGGVAAWHILTVVDAVQSTLGIRVLQVNAG